MAQPITDLDELLGADKRVRLGGKVWTLPGDLPAELYLQVMRLAREDASEAEMIEALYDQLLDLFSYKEPGLKKLPVTINQVVNGIAYIYGDGNAAKGHGAARPPRARGASSSKRSRSRG